MGELYDFYGSLPQNLRSAAYTATKTVIDLRQRTFNQDLVNRMTMGQREYFSYPNWVNVHTKTKLHIYEKEEVNNGVELVKYGYKNFNSVKNASDSDKYKTVPWTVHNLRTKGNGKKVKVYGGGDHQVAFSLIAFVTSTGRLNKGNSKGGTYIGTHFIKRTIHSDLNGIDKEIFEKFDMVLAARYLTV